MLLLLSLAWAAPPDDGAFTWLGRASPGTPRGEVRAVRADESGVWVAWCHPGRIGHFDPASGRWRSWPDGPVGRSCVSDVARVDGVTWAASEPSLLRLDATGVWASQSIDMRITRLAAGPDGTLLLGAGARWEVRPGETRVARVGEVSGFIRAITITADGETWSAPDEGLRRGRDAATSVPGVTGTIAAVAADGEQVWAAGEDGLFRADTRGGERVAADLPMPTGLLTQLAITRDAIWVASRAAFARVERSLRSAEVWSAATLGLSRIGGMASDEAGAVWIAGDEGLARRDPTTGAWERWRAPTGGFPAGGEVALGAGPDVSIVRHGEVYRFDEERLSWELLRGTDAARAKDVVVGDEARAAFGPRGRVRSVARTPGGGAWYGSDADGAAWRSPTGAWTRLDPVMLDAAVVRAVYATPRAASGSEEPPEVWIATERGVRAWSPRAGMRYWRARDGLPSDDVRAVFRDEAGAIWAGTNVGLARMGPGEARFAPAEPFAGRVVRGIRAGPDGALWVAGDGVARRDPGSGTWTVWRGGATHPEGYGRALGADAAGGVWYAADGGVARFEPRTGAVEGYSLRASLVAPVSDGMPKPLGAGASTTEPRVVDGPEGVYIAAPSGVWLYHPPTRRLERIRERGVGAIAAGRGALWIHDGERLFRRDPTAPGGWTEAPAARGRYGGLEGLWIGGDGAVWAAHARGVDRHDRAAGAWVPADPDPSVVPSSRVRVDRGGRVWMFAGGQIVRHDPATGTWTRAAPPKSFTGFVPDDAGHVWLRSDGLQRFDLDAGTLTSAAVSKAWPLGAPIVAPDGSVWARSLGRELLRYDPTRDTAETVRVEAGPPIAAIGGRLARAMDGAAALDIGGVLVGDPGVADRIVAVAVDGDAWAALRESGAVLLGRGTDVTDRVLAPVEEPVAVALAGGRACVGGADLVCRTGDTWRASPHEGAVNALVIEGGRTWYGTDGGVCVVGGVCHETPRVMSLAADRGVVWAGTVGGLFRVTTGGAEAVGPRDPVRAITPDRDMLWLGTEGPGLVRWGAGGGRVYGVGARPDGRSARAVPGPGGTVDQVVLVGGRVVARQGGDAYEVRASDETRTR